MITRNILFLSFFNLNVFQLAQAIPLAQQFKQTGYVEICDTDHGTVAFDALYEHFDELTEFLQTHPVWAHKLHAAKERFIRTKEKSLYSSDFFGFYDESQARSQIAFYYSTHFHQFICAHYPEFEKVPQITRFLQACRTIQQPYAPIFDQVATELGLKTIFASYAQPPILLKVVKYLPSYNATKPHYDGTAFSIFLDSTDNQSLLLCPYKSTFSVDDFSCPVRTFSRSCNQNSILLIPGALLTEFSIYPTPHIVTQSGQVRYATVAFAMRPNYVLQKSDLSVLPNFNR